MKALIRFALLIILMGILGLHNVSANCTGDYVAEYHSVYLADVSHPPPSPEYVEYSLYGELGGDYDLFVLDTWNDTWYSSETADPNEYLKIPIHSGYDHKVYVWTYDGSGSWTVCSPQVTFGAGFRRIDDSDTAPNVAANDIITSAPSPTSTIAAEPRPVSSGRYASSSDSASTAVSRPVTGTYIKPLVDKGYGEVLINNGLTKDAVVVMTKSSGATLFSVYVRAGEQVGVEGITDGTYRLFFTSGDGWDYAKKEFGRSQEYYLMEGTMPFTTRTTSKETVYTIYEVTLHLVSDGNVDRLPVNKAGFPKLA